MNLDKSELKMALAQSWGEKIEDFKECSEKEATRLEGANGALMQARQSIESSVKSFYKKDLDEDKISPDEFKTAARAIDRCLGVLVSLCDKTIINRVGKLNEANGIAKCIDYIKRQYDGEKEKVIKAQAYVNQVSKEDSNVVRISDSGIVKKSLKQQRAKTITQKPKAKKKRKKAAHAKNS